MKLSEITKETKFPEFEHFTVRWANNPFWDVYITPKNNPYGLFVFSIMETDYNSDYSCGMFKTSYYRHPVISKGFSKENTLEDVVNWIKEVFLKIKNELLE